MNDLAEQLIKAGLAKAPSPTEAEKPKVQSVHGDAKSVSDLVFCKNTRQFREAVRAILLRDVAQAQSLIREVIQAAHEFREQHSELFHADEWSYVPTGQDEGNRFVWYFYAIRDELRELPPEEWRDFLRQALSKSGVKWMRQRVQRRQ